jgi:hypothetical protein
MMEFPVIHTNFWDGVIAVPAVLIMTQLIKVFTKMPKKYVPTLAVVLGLIFSIFISHPKDIVAGIFMGFFYGNAAVGSYASIKTFLLSFRSTES